MTEQPWYPPEPDGSPGQGWHEHTPGDPMPCEPDALVEVVTEKERQSRIWGEGGALADQWYWKRDADRDCIAAWRYVCPAMRRLQAESAKLRAELAEIKREREQANKYFASLHALMLRQKRLDTESEAAIFSDLDSLYEP